MGKTTILLVDDHTLFRQSLRKLLETRPNIVVDDVSDGEEAIRWTKSEKPDIAFVDISMPNLGGLEAIYQMRKDSSETKFVILSMYDRDEYIREALRIGVVGYVLKTATADEFFLALESIMKGESYLSPQIAKKVIKNFFNDNSKPETTFSKLTRREREILRLIAEAKTSKEIASRLGISVATAQTHRANLMRKLNAHHVSELVRIATREGLVES